MPTIVNRITPNDRRYTLDGRIGRLRVRGAKLTANVAAAILSGTLDLSTTAVTQLDLTIADPDLELLASRLFTPGDDHRAGSALDYADLRLEVATVEATDGNLIIAARSLGAQKLRRARGKLIRRGLSPTQWAALEAKATGLKFVGQPSAKRSQIVRQAGDQPESSWDTLQRLASELGYICFESAGVLYFGRPVWLADQAAGRLRIAWDGAKTDPRILRQPSCRRTGDSANRKLAEVTLEVTGELGDDVRTGHRLTLDGVPTFDGRYLIDGVTIPLEDASPVAIKASTPVNPTPEPPEKHTGTASTSTASVSTASGATGPGTAGTFVRIALAQAGDAYVFGAEAAATDPDPDAFDCSELVEWAAARVGVRFVDGSANQLARVKRISVEQGIRTRGALLFHPGHVAISLGDGRTIEAASRQYGVRSFSAAGRFTAAGLIPGLAY